MRYTNYLLSSVLLTCILLLSCSKDCEHLKPKSRFTYEVINPGVLPTKIDFTSTSMRATKYEWEFGDGTKISTTNNTIRHLFVTPGSYYVELIAINPIGTDTSGTLITVGVK